MRLIPYREDEWPGLTRLQDEMNRLFEGFFSGAPRRMDWQPRVDVVETPETLVVKAELPGIAPGDVDISVAGDVLTIRGEKKAETEEKGKTWYRRERTSGSFARSITLPFAVDANRIEAEEKSGVITITLPKREEAKPKKVQIKVK